MSTPWARCLPSGEPAGAAAPADFRADAVAPAPAALTLRYPPADPGLPLLAADAILAANEDLIARLRLHAAVSPAQLQERFLLPLRRLALSINVLPATAAGLFSGEMGLFRAALESAFYAFQASDGRIFTGAEGVERRHALEGRWRYLCFLAGLLHPLGRPLERLVVASADGRIWKRHIHGLDDWAAAQGVDRVFVSWGSCHDADVPGPGAASLHLLPHIIGASNLQHLEDGAADLVGSLQQLALGQPGSSPVAHQVVTNCWERIRRREALRRPQAYGRLVAGTHQAPYLLGAMRTLVRSGQWVPNASCLRADAAGIYLQWPQAAADLIAWGRHQGYQGWPGDPATLAALLAAAGIVHEHTSDLGLLQIRDPSGQWHQALKFVDPLSVLEDYVPQACAPTRPPSASGSAGVPQLGLAADAMRQQCRSPAPGPLPPAPVPLPKGRDAATGQAGLTPGTVATAASAAPPASQLPPHASLESTDSRHAALVPPELQKEISHAAHLELLGKVVQAWRERSEGCETLRRIDAGAAVALSFLAQHSRDVTTWVDAMARAGLVYAPPHTPGLRVQKIRIPEDGNSVAAVVLSNLACRKLQL
ncbi:MAG: hypothetical protein JWQ76_3872 [Ramlibacter sp.]|nr:hypothetical protein [Ramlibacter sp.]